MTFSHLLAQGQLAELWLNALSIATLLLKYLACILSDLHGGCAAHKLNSNLCLIILSLEQMQVSSLINEVA